MVTDYLITIGLVVGLFSIPAMLSAYADERFPRAPMAAFILSAATIALAWAMYGKGQQDKLGRNVTFNNFVRTGFQVDAA